MSLSDEQWEFLIDVASLIDYAEREGYKMTAGHLFRTSAQQYLYFFGYTLTEKLKLIKTKKRSKTKSGYHQKRLAIDFNVFINGKLTYTVNDIKPLGEYWKSLNPLNVWGGDWGWDSGHFQRSYN